MRPTKLVAGAALTAALALVALPSLAGSRSPSTAQDLDAASLHELTVSAIREAPPAIEPLDVALRSDGFLDADATLVEPGLEGAAMLKPAVPQPAAKARSEQKPARYTLTGGATFYDNGTTAMRLPRGTIVIICGAGGCIERVVNDWGPQRTSRIVDLYRPDFFAICGCPWYAGNTQVTVHVY